MTGKGERKLWRISVLIQVFVDFSGENLAGFVQKDIRIFLSYRIKSREGNLKVASAWLFSQIKLPLKGQRQKILVT